MWYGQEKDNKKYTGGVEPPALTLVLISSIRPFELSAFFLLSIFSFIRVILSYAYLNNIVPLFHKIRTKKENAVIRHSL